eukprot:225833-Pleurochrysis_carterae.AAC.2
MQSHRKCMRARPEAGKPLVQRRERQKASSCAGQGKWKMRIIKQKRKRDAVLPRVRPSSFVGGRAGGEATSPRAQRCASPCGTQMGRDASCGSFRERG